MTNPHDITIRTELRPCLVDGEPCIFHKWVTDYQPRSTYLVDEDGEGDCEIAIFEVTMGLVEHQDGSVSTESMELIKFTDSASRFSRLFSQEQE